MERQLKSIMLYRVLPFLIGEKEEFRVSTYLFWNNHGTYWHLDHIIPISWAKSEEEVYKLNHYTNFQPLSAFENLAKNNRFAG
jgi:hypothetical protein